MKEEAWTNYSHGGQRCHKNLGPRYSKGLSATHYSTRKVRDIVKDEIATGVYLPTWY